MKAIVVYESLWGNTAAIARAIAEGIGSGARALSTARSLQSFCALVARGAPRGARPLGRVRNAHLVVARGRHIGDHQGAEARAAMGSGACEGAVVPEQYVIDITAI